MPIKYVKGDLFEAIQHEVVVIPHVVNDEKLWGAGFVLPLTRCFPKSRAEYLAWEKCTLGHTQFVECSNTNNKAIVANMCAQKGVGGSWIDGKEVPPIRYEALRICMFDVKQKIAKENLKIVCPMFGSGLSGGDWLKIEEMIYEIWNEFDVTIYYFPQFLPQGFNPVGRTDKTIADLIKHKEKTAIDVAYLTHSDLAKCLAMLQNNPWPHTNRHCEVQRTECIKLVEKAIEQTIELKKVLELQEVQERNLQ